MSVNGTSHDVSSYMGLAKAVRRILFSVCGSSYPHMESIAPGFQTSVKKIRITPDIAARIRRGEEVSPEEIAEASARAEKVQESPSLLDRPPLVERVEKVADSEKQSVNEWLPESITKPQKRGKARRR